MRSSITFPKKLAGLLPLVVLLSFTLFSWKPVSRNLFQFIYDLRFKFQHYIEHTATTKVYLVCDKPLYEPGDVIWFSVFSRNGNTLEQSNSAVTVELLNPQGTVVAKHQLGTSYTAGSYSGNFNLKADQAGGLYKLKVYPQDEAKAEKSPVFVKEIQVQQVVMPRLKVTLDFDRKAYGPGSEVTATVKAFSNNNRPLSGNNFRFVVSLDGSQLQEAGATVDKQGKATVKFNLPADLETPDGLLNLVFQHEGQTESVSRSIPIVLNKINLSFFPEGGDLVTGLESQVAFRALNEFNRPADISGEIVDQAGQFVSTFSSYHDGMGEFSFKPEAGKTYEARLTSPAGIATPYALPSALKNGYIMQVSPPNGEVLKVTIRSTIAARAALVGQMRGQWHFERVMDLKPGDNHLELMTAELPIGVLQLTLFDNKAIERAERLVFVNNHKQLHLEVKTDKEKYLPREKVTVTINTADETGLPMPADLMLSVVDDQLLTFMNDKSSNMLSWMLVESEIKGKVEEPKFYFDKTEPKAPVALDLLLKTSGWRRFTWEEVRNTVLPDYKYAVANLLHESYYEVSYPQTSQVYKEISGQLKHVKTKKPVAGIEVSLIKEGKVLTKTSADDQGKFSFPNLGRGTYSLSILNEDEEPYLITNIEIIHHTNTFLDIKYPEKEKSITGYKGPGKIEKAEVQVKFSKPNPNSEFPEPTGKIKGRLVDKTTREPVPFGNVVVKQKGIQKGYALTDIDGMFSISPLKPGFYTIECPNVGYVNRVINNVEVRGGVTTGLNISLDSNVRMLYSVEITAYREPLGYTGFKGPRERVQKMPVQKPAAKRQASATDPSSDESGLQIRGTRSSQTVYYVNGVKQLVPGNLPENATRNGRKTGRNTGIPAGDPIQLDGKMVYKEKSQQVTPQEEAREFTRVREFAAPVYAQSETVQERTDFRKTLFWRPLIRVGREGTATFQFYTGDEITSYNILVEGISPDGSPGRTESKFFTQLPVSLSAKLPVATLEKDQISVPLLLQNNTNQDVSGKLELNHPQGWKFLGKTNPAQLIKANSSQVVQLDYEVSAYSGAYTFGAAFTAQGFRDAFSQPVTVEPRGYPMQVSVSGNSKEQDYVLNLTNMAPGTASISFSAYPSVYADLLKGIEGMLQEPYGCFEQTCSSSYPNILVLDYLKSQPKPDLAAIEKAEGLLAKGYKRMLTFETKEKGFEYFGEAPGNVNLTAYALLQFADMQRVGGKVDAAVIKNTTNWLMNQRDGKGGFKQDAPGSRYSLPSPEVANAYIVYSLSEAGYPNLKPELDLVCQSLEKKEDPYLLALATNALFSSGDHTRGNAFLTKLLDYQQENGSWKGQHHSATYSTGHSLEIETTALALLAMLKAKEKSKLPLQKGINFLLARRNSYGSFGSTQATVLALKAIAGYSNFMRSVNEAGTVQFLVENKKAGERHYAAGQTGEIIIDSLEHNFRKPGSYQIKVQYQKTKDPLPYSLSVNYFSNQPPTSAACKVKLETSLSAPEITVGSTVRYTAKLQNQAAEGLPMTMAIIGIPAGLSVQPWQLKELQEKKVFDFYEINGNRLICYFRAMAPSQERIINLDLKAEVPGTFEGPAGSAYLYYTNEHKYWAAGPKIIVKPIKANL